MPVVFKSIKAARLRQDKMRLALLNGMRKAGRVILKEDIEPTVATWDKPAKFEMLVSLSSGEAATVWETNDVRWHWTDKGTRPHEIWAGAYTGKSDKRYLRIPSGFKPKTTPGKLKSGAGRKGGPPNTYVAMVNHPGTKPRRWSEMITKRRQPWYRKRMQRVMKDVARASGAGEK